MAGRVRVREISDDEGNRLKRMVRRGSGSVVTWRRAQMVLWSAQGMSVAQIAGLAFTSEDRVRDVLHNFNADGFESLLSLVGLELGAIDERDASAGLPPVVHDTLPPAVGQVQPSPATTGNWPSSEQTSRPSCGSSTSYPRRTWNCVLNSRCPPPTSSRYARAMGSKCCRAALQLLMSAWRTPSAWARQSRWSRARPPCAAGTRQRASLVRRLHHMNAGAPVLA